MKYIQIQNKKCYICGRDNPDYVDWFFSTKQFTNIERYYHKRCKRLVEEKGK